MSVTAGHVAQVLLGAVNVSAAFREMRARRSAATADATNFASGGNRQRVAGVTDLTIAGQGLFDSDATAAGMSAILDALQGVSAGAVITYAPEGLTEGKRAVAGKATMARSEIRPVVGDVVGCDADFEVNDYGGIGLLARNSIAADETVGFKTAYDLGHLTSKGGRAVLHRTAGTGAFDIRIQHSVDNITYADLVTVTGSGTGAFTADSSGLTVNRWIRASVVTAGTSTRYVLAFMRG